MKTLLLVEDDTALGSVTSKALEKRGLHVIWCQTIEASREALSSAAIDLAVLDLKLEQETSLDIIPELRAKFPESSILVLTAYASIATAVEAVKRGADNYLPKPATVSDILSALEEKQIAKDESQEDNLMSPKRLEWEHIQRALLKNNGNISATARELNMHRRTLQRKLGKYPVKQ